MFSSNQLNSLIQQILGPQSQQDSSGKDKKRNGKQNGGVSISPSQALVIAGLISGALEVTSVLVDRDQEVQIVLAGSLKRKTELEKMVDQIGEMSFEEVMKAILNRFG